jgi:hypothetical protein
MADRPANKHNMAKSTWVAPEVLPINSAPVDDETRAEVGPSWIHIRDYQGFTSVALTLRFEEAWGPFPVIKTGTDEKNGLIYIYKGDVKNPKHIPVIRSGAGNSASFSLYIPLQKLGLQVAADRQWEVIPYEQQFDDGSVAFVLPMKTLVSQPRSKQGEESTTPPDAAAPGTADATAAADGATKAPLDPKMAKEVARVKRMMAAEKLAFDQLIDEQVEADQAKDEAESKALDKELGIEEARKKYREE